MVSLPASGGAREVEAIGVSSGAIVLSSLFTYTYVVIIHLSISLYMYTLYCLHCSNVEMRDPLFWGLACLEYNVIFM